MILTKEVFMQALIERIKREGKNLGDGILKVDGFINHQVDPQLMDACGCDSLVVSGWERRKCSAEISGIAPPLRHHATARYAP
jgi:xanthine phosphoribosyltransferase